MDVWDDEETLKSIDVGKLIAACNVPNLSNYDNRIENYLHLMEAEVVNLSYLYLLLPKCGLVINL